MLFGILSFVRGQRRLFHAVCLEVLKSLVNMPPGSYQRIDGLRCERGVLRLTKTDQSIEPFIKALLRLGIIEESQSGDLRPLPMYRVKDQERITRFGARRVVRRGVS